jgi:hypothetical protein
MSRAMRVMKIPRPRPILFFLAALALLCGCLGPHGMSDELVDVTGEFRADGTCDAQTSKGSVAARDGDGRTSYQIGRAFNVARRGFTPHSVTCRFPGDGNAALSLNRFIAVTVGVRGQEPLRVGRYAVSRYGVQDTTGTQASLGVHHPAFDVGTPGSGRGGQGGQIWLEGVSGWLDIERVDTNRVVARFTIRARREWSM